MVHLYDEFAQFNMYIPGKTRNLAKFKMGARIVDNLKANMLVGNDILELLGVIMNLPWEIITLQACPGVTIPIKVHPNKELLKHTDRVVCSDRLICILAKSKTLVPIKLWGSARLPSNWDFIFKPVTNNQLRDTEGFLTHIIDLNTEFIEAYNTTEKEVVLLRHTRLGQVTEYKAQGCYSALKDDAIIKHAINSSKKRSWLK